MKLSIITVNFNNAAGLQRTMDSAFHQTFTDYEYVIIDGGSTDGSKDLIKNHANKLVYWVSEKDNGVYQAMNKGIVRAKGDYLLFLNSGDYLLHERILDEIANDLDGTELVYGNVFIIKDAQNSWTGIYPDKLSFQHFTDSSLPHPCTFIKRSLFEKVGYFDESLFITADWKFFLDAICRYNISYKRIDKTIAAFDHNGLSSLPENQALIRKEKRKVLESVYPSFISDSYELKKLRAFRNNLLVNRFVKVAQMFGRLKDF